MCSPSRCKIAIDFAATASDFCTGSDVRALVAKVFGLVSQTAAIYDDALGSRAMNLYLFP